MYEMSKTAVRHIFFANAPKGKYYDVLKSSSEYALELGFTGIPEKKSSKIKKTDRVKIFEKKENHFASLMIHLASTQAKF